MRRSPEAKWSPAGRGFGRRWTVRLGATPLERARIGGKAAGLQRLIAAGLEVPDAFCVTVDGFEAVVAELVERVDDLDGLRQALLGAELPAGFRDEVASQMDAIGASRWAVRSSAVAEDEPERSYAGQQETVLGVEGVDDVLQAIRTVWASLYDTAPMLYRSRLGVDAVPEPMAVVVQALVEPESAGVLFTRNPVSGDHAQLVINAAAGMGTAVVDGGQTDTYYVSKATGYVERHELGSERVEAAGPALGTLSAEQIARLADVARRVERVRGAPQDVEWAFAAASPAEARSGIASRLYLLQSRDITGVDGAPASSVWTNANVGEALPGVATPLTWSIIRRFSRRGFEQAFGSLGLTVPEDYELVGSFRGRVYLNLTQFVAVASGVPILKPDTLFEMAGGGGLELVRDVEAAGTLGTFLKRLPVTIPRVALSQLSMPVVGPAWGSYFETRRDAFFARDLSRLGHDEFRGELDRVDLIFERMGLVMLSASSNFLMSYVVMYKLLAWWGGPGATDHVRELVSGLAVDSAEPGLDLLELGRLARRSRRIRRVIEACDADAALAELEALREHADVAVFLDELERFRATHGHRAPREAELATPRWREDVGFIFDVVRGHLRAAHLPSKRQMERERTEQRRRVDALVDETLLPGLRSVFRSVLWVTRQNATLREYLRARVVDTLDMYRRYFLECGRRLADQGLLARADDVFFLKHAEVRSWLDDVRQAANFRLRVLVRRELFERFTAMDDLPNTFLLRGGEIISEAEALGRAEVDAPAGAATEIRGLPGSGGRVTGRARVMTDPNADATLEPGEVLVAPFTDVGWTPLFLTASAVVTNLGGPLSHSCIVAREYGIPTVVNAHRATERIRSGDRITVDGDRGVVYVHRED